jgi:hypothetical protein
MTGNEAEFDGQGAGYITRGSGGGFITFKFSEKFALQAEVLYAQKGGNWEYTETVADTTWTYRVEMGLEYVEISLLAKFMMPTSGKIQPYFMVGPAVGINANSEAKFRTIIDTLGTKIFDLGDQYYSNIFNAKSTVFEGIVGGGLGIRMGSNMFILEGRYTLSFDKPFDDLESPSSLTDDDAFFVNDEGKGSDMKHSVFSILIGFSFGLN